MLKLPGPRGVQQHQPRLLSEKQLECVPGCKSMNDPIDFTLAMDATGAECTLCLRGKMIQKELAAQESGGGWNRCRPAGEGRQKGCPGGKSCQRFVGSCFVQMLRSPAASCLELPAPAGRAI